MDAWAPCPGRRLLRGVRLYRPLDLCLHSLEIEARALLHWRELDGSLSNLRDLLLDELEPPELVREPVVEG